MPGVEKFGLLDKQSLNITALVEPSVSVLEEVIRPQGYAIDGLACYRSVVELAGRKAEGWGTGSPDLAKVKAVSEAIERFCMFSVCETDRTISSSNGWSAHTTIERAKENAVSELIERDTALRTWFNAGPYYLVPKEFWPATLLKWDSSKLKANIEFAKATVLLTNGPFGCCLSVLLQTSDWRTVVGHASGREFQQTIESAFFEALRSAHAALRFEEFPETNDLHSSEPPTVDYGPGANGMAYAYGATLPNLSIGYASNELVVSAWNEHNERLTSLIARSDFTVFKVGTRFVVRAKAIGIQDIFWGRTPGEMNVKNKLPHFVG